MSLLEQPFQSKTDGDVFAAHFSGPHSFSAENIVIFKDARGNSDAVSGMPTGTKEWKALVSSKCGHNKVLATQLDT